MRTYLALAAALLFAACTPGASATEDAALVPGALETTPVVVNECAIGTGGWIELHNASASAVDLAGDATRCWYVDDVEGGGAPKRITDAVVSHAAGSTTCAAAGRAATCGLLAPHERVWVPYAYLNTASADACRLVSAGLVSGACDATRVDASVGGATAAGATGTCFGRTGDGGPWSTASVTCSANGGSNGPACAVGTLCDDANACTLGETLQADCSCGGGIARSCDDTDACTADSCDATLGCVHGTTPCDDGNACTADACDPAGGCSHVALSCDDGDTCTVDACDTGTGACMYSATSCDDANPCTADSCAAGGCDHVAVADGTACGVGATCMAGTCAGTAEIVDGAETRILLTGTILGPDGPFAGEVLVEGTLITCVAPSCSSQPGAAGATRIDTHGIVMPGLIDSHNHGLFNVFDETDWSPIRFYTNHNQWTGEARYGAMVDAKQYLAGESGSPVDYRCEMDQWGELRAMVGGTTSMLVAPGTSRTCFSGLIRTIDTPANDLGADRIQTSISIPSETTATGICRNFASGATNAYVVHVAEGVDETARREFDLLGSRSGGCLLAPQTTIVHGTALGAREFDIMAAHGMALVWSPRSNDFLYDATTQIQLAVAAGVGTIALAPDWALGGSANLLDELRYAREVDRTRLGGLLGEERLVRMVTIDAARALGLEAQLGSLEVGKRADILVIPGSAANPYGALFEATPGTVRLLMVDGRVLYGDAALEAAGPVRPGCEHRSIEGRDKFLCVAEESTDPMLRHTFSEIESRLVTALADYDAQFMTPTTAFSPLSPLVP